MSTSTGPGIHTMPATDYHADPAEQPSLSASLATILCTQSPAHAYAAHPRLNPNHHRTDDDKFDLGTACHALILQGDDIVRVVYADAWRTAEAKALRDEARADGLIPLLEKDWLRVQEMHAAVRAQLDTHTARPALFANGQAEQTLIWQDNGVTCRARLDWLHDDHTAIDDLKTTGASADPAKWLRTMYGIGADVQVAFYLRGVQALTGVEAEFRFVVVETFAPFALSVVSLGPSALALANEKVDVAIDTWRRCLTSGRWPGYQARVASVELPAWEEARWLERDAQVAAA